MKKKLVVSVAIVALALAAVPALAFANIATNVAHFPFAVSQGVVKTALTTASDVQNSVAIQKNDVVEVESPAANPASCLGFVDANGDSVCDNYASGSCVGHMNGNGFVDADGDGVCDNYGAGYGGHGCAASYCGGYLDADGNGVCDNYGSRGYGAGGNGAGYVDSDNNGVCDNYGTRGGGNGRGTGGGSGYVDSNNDGTCDNFGTGSNGNGGNGRGNGGQRGCMR